LYRTFAGLTGKDTQELAGRSFPRDETVTTISVAVKVQARNLRKKGTKALVLQKDCKVTLFLRIVRRMETPKWLPCGSKP
jgi:hypothetical protein